MKKINSNTIIQIKKQALALICNFSDQK